MLDIQTARQVKWHHAMKPKPVAKIANLDMRMAAYQVEWRSFLWEMASFAAIGACIIFPAVYFLPNLLALFDAPPREREPFWWAVAGVLWVGLLVPPFMMMNPERPSEADVQADVALRRQVGMDDSVAE